VADRPLWCIVAGDSHSRLLDAPRRRCCKEPASREGDVAHAIARHCGSGESAHPCVRQIDHAMRLGRSTPSWRLSRTRSGQAWNGYDGSREQRRRNVQSARDSWKADLKRVTIQVPGHRGPQPRFRRLQPRRQRRAYCATPGSGHQQQHRGARTTLEEFFSGYEESRRIFDRLRAAIDALGPAEVRATKSQIAFRRSKAFAWAWVPARYLRGSHAPLVLTMSFRERDRSRRWKQIVEPAPGRFTDHLELYSTAEIDDEVLCWLQEAWEAAA
jgi:hypothetical protein